MTFLAVVEGDAGGWRIDWNALTEAIRARWAGTVIDSTFHSEARSLTWEFETAGGPGDAYLHEGGSCLYMDVRETDAIWLTIAFSRLIPMDLDLVFCDEGYTFDVRLPAGTTEAELTDLVTVAG